MTLPTMPRTLAELPEFRVMSGAPREDGHFATCQVHAPEACAGRPCPFHAPSDHPLNDAPWFLWHSNYGWLTMRVCEHRVAHPDPDSVAFMVERIPPEFQNDEPITHRPCCYPPCCEYGGHW